MYPPYWGPIYWKYIHTYIFLLPNKLFHNNENKENLKEFLNLFFTTLPCEQCSIHSKHYLKINPINENVLGNKENLFVWLNNFHNAVNKQSNKKEYTIIESKRKVIFWLKENIKNNQLYLVHKKGSKNHNLILFIITITSITMLIILILKKKKIKKKS